MVISPYNAAVRPYTMPPWICASIWPTFTAGPQSTAQTTRCTRTAPSGATETSATCAHTVGCHSANAMPRPRPAGSGVPQLEGILLCRRRHLVHEALGDERVVRDTDGAPEPARDR